MRFCCLLLRPFTLRALLFFPVPFCAFLCHHVSFQQTRFRISRHFTTTATRIILYTEYFVLPRVLVQHAGTSLAEKFSSPSLEPANPIGLTFREKSMRELKSWGVGCHSLQNILPSSLSMKMYETVMLSVAALRESNL